MLESEAHRHATKELLAEAWRRLKMNLPLLEQLKRNTADKVIARLREEWAEPLEELVEELKLESTKYAKTDKLIRRVMRDGKQTRLGK